MCFLCLPTLLAFRKVAASTKEAEAKRTGEVGKWKVQLVDWLHSMGISSGTKSPWAGDILFKGTGIPITDRVRGLLDAVVWQKLGKAAGTMSFKQKQLLLKDTYVDISQNPVRRPYTNAQGILGTMTTSSVYYSFDRDGVVLPYEMLLWHGHSRLLRVPPETKGRALKALAGEGMSAPCLGSVLWAAFLIRGYP